MADLRILVDGTELAADWTDENHEVRAALVDVLPVAGDATRWGEELYFDVPVDATPAATREAVPVGAVAYWPTGNALCLFWGETPASRGEEPRAAGPVAVLAELEGTSALADLDGGARVRVERA